MDHVDVTGEICPRPALIVRRRLAELEADDELVVYGDYPPAEANLRRTCQKHGYVVEGYEGSERNPSPTDDGFALRIRVEETAESETNDQ